MTCVKPFTVPDRWTNGSRHRGDGSDTYDAFDNKGRPLANPDVYIPRQAWLHGYNQESMRGQC
jgi:hypothetical protein